jgi:hypothetical protein
VNTSLASQSIFQAHIGRDNGKCFRAVEVDPLTMAGYVLRLTSALKVPDWSAVQTLFAARPENDPDGINSDDAINAVMDILRGCDAAAVHALVTEALTYVEVAPDPRHPEAWRRLNVAPPNHDIQELRTLGGVLMTFAAVNLSLGS